MREGNKYKALLPGQAAAFSVDPSDLQKCPIIGVLRQTLEYMGRERRFLFYIPEKMRYNRPCIIAVKPSGMETETFMEKSGLRKLADINGLYLCFPEPERDGWKLDGRDGAFVNLVYQRILQREYYVILQDCIYGMGFEDGAAVIQQAAMGMTSEWAGMASFGKLGPEVFNGCGSVMRIQDTVGSELDILAEKCQLPVWMFTDEEDDWTKKVLDYWLKENQYGADYLYTKRNTRVYLPCPIKNTSKINDDLISQTRITAGYTKEWLNTGFLQWVWNYIGMARRHRCYKKKALRYYRAPEKNGAEKHTIYVDGLARQWYEYVPEWVIKEKSPVPVVVVLHGRGGDGGSFFDITDMSVVAEERGLIALFPTADVYQMEPGGLKNISLWNGTIEGKKIDSLKFIRQMIGSVCGRLPVDQGRIFVCGQSSGGFMALYCAMAASDLFAACVSWSGYCCFNKEYPIFFYDKKEAFQFGNVPICIMFGEDDKLFDIRGEGDFARTDNPAASFIRFLVDRFSLEEKPGIYRCRPVTYYVWCGSQGVPILKVGIVEKMGHANYAEQSRMAYDDFFALFSRTGTMGFRYMGKTF